jgi:hypothetical protein
MGILQEKKVPIIIVLIIIIFGSIIYFTIDIQKKELSMDKSSTQDKYYDEYAQEINNPDTITLERDAII